MPRVSVLVAAYNAEPFIDQALRSLQSQTFRDWEAIIVDDKSTDGTLTRLQEWQAREPRIRVFAHTANSGCGAARQTAFLHANGEYCAVLDSDDVALPQWLQGRIACFDRRRSTVVVTGPMLRLHRDGSAASEGRPAWSPSAYRWGLLFGNPVNDPACMFRTRVAADAGGYRTLRMAADWDLWTRLIEVGDIDEDPVLRIKYRIHEGSLCQNEGKIRAGMQPAACQIMSRTLVRLLGLELDPELAWYLFRDRPVFAGERHSAANAFAFLEAALERFLRVFPEEPSGTLRLAVLRDVANVFRCGGWSPRRCLRMGVDLGRLEWRPSVVKLDLGTALAFLGCLGAPIVGRYHLWRLSKS